jgi:hypothetical protein
VCHDSRLSPEPDLLLKVVPVREARDAPCDAPCDAPVQHANAISTKRLQATPAAAQPCTPAGVKACTFELTSAEMCEMHTERPC